MNSVQARFFVPCRASYLLGGGRGREEEELAARREGESKGEGAEHREKLGTQEDERQAGKQPENCTMDGLFPFANPSDSASSRSFADVVPPHQERRWRHHARFFTDTLTSTILQGAGFYPFAQLQLCEHVTGAHCGLSIPPLLTLAQRSALAVSVLIGQSSVQISPQVQKSS